MSPLTSIFCLVQTSCMSASCTTRSLARSMRDTLTLNCSCLIVLVNLYRSRNLAIIIITISITTFICTIQCQTHLT